MKAQHAGRGLGLIVDRSHHGGHVERHAHCAGGVGDNGEDGTPGAQGPKSDPGGDAADTEPHGTRTVTAIDPPAKRQAADRQQERG